MRRATAGELVEGLAGESLAGRGRLVPDRAPPHRDKRHVHCDVLVIGGGAAGCAAASAAAAGGARVILAERTPVLGAQVAPAEELQVLTRTAAVGAYDDGYVVLAQRDRLWHVRARRVILASGAVERTVAFAGNDRPGVMLASAAAAYVERYAVAPGSTAVLFAADDSGHAAAEVLERVTEHEGDPSGIHAGGRRQARADGTHAEGLDRPIRSGDGGNVGRQHERNR